MSDNNKIVKFQRGFQFNVGIFLMIFIVLYLAFHVFSSATKKDVVAYEVSLGTIVEKNFYQGMALRSEEIVTCDREGTPYYYENNRVRVGAKSTIYAVDTKGDIIGKLKGDNENYRNLSGEELKDLAPKVESFLGGFEGVNFQNVYPFAGEVSDYISDVLVKDLEESFAPDIERAKTLGTYYDYPAPKTGLVVYSVDGYEAKTLDDLKAEDFNPGGVSVTNLRTKSNIKAGDPAYKLITEDDWKLVIPIDKDKANEVRNLENIQIRFTQDNVKTWASSTVISKDNAEYLLLSFDDGMERYASQRFINVELLLTEKQGLKIPDSAITEKSFYVVPKSFFFAGGNSLEQGIMIRHSGGKDEFIIPQVYYETESEYYIDNEHVSAGDKLIKENSAETYTVGAKTDKLLGVYNINKGFALFKKIDVLYRNSEYAIVRNQANYSISLYDHIVLDASSVKENEII